MKSYTCELCGMAFTYQYGIKPRWCPDDRPAGRRRRASQTKPELLTTGLARTVVSQRLAMEQAIHALSAACLARQIGWDDTTWLDAALEALIDVPTLREAVA